MNRWEWMSRPWTLLLLLLLSTAGILKWWSCLLLYWLAAPEEGVEAAGEWQSPFVPGPVEDHGP